MLSLYTLCMTMVMASSTLAQDPMLKKPEIYSLNIHSDITYRYATTRVTSRLKNHGEQPREALFQVTLPNEAFITNLTIEIDGEITVGEIKEKEVAKAQYVAAQQRGESAGYIGTKHRETNKFELAITVAPQKKISFNLTYQELLKRKLGYYEQVIFIDPGTTVKNLDVTVNILESRDITTLTVPPLRNDVGDAVNNVDNIIVISQPTTKSATIRYSPSVEQQRLQSDNGIAGRFVVQYDVERGMDFGDVLMVNGYFVHFFAPEGLQPMPNDVLFILDVSGSMVGRKIKQLKKAMLSNLEQLSPNDRFNIMTFSNKIKLWRQSMMNVDDEDAFEDAKLFINRLNANGWTDINSALTSGLSFLADQLGDDDGLRSSIIVFLTDGEPTKGEENPEQILRNVQQANEGNVPIFTLAFGKGADWDFVKKLALQNDGFGRKIYEASDAAMQIMGFYNEISVTLLSNLTFNYLDVEASNVTQSHFSNYFNGSEVVICGFAPELADEMNVEVKFKSASGYNSTNVIISGDLNKDFFGDVDNVTDAINYEQITEKVWAYLTIKQLLEQMEAAGDNSEAKKIKAEILRMSLRYGFVTPLTSMVVTQKQDNVTKQQPIEIQPVDVSEPIRRQKAQSHGSPMMSYGSPTGSRGFAQHFSFAHDPFQRHSARVMHSPGRPDPVQPDPYIGSIGAQTGDIMDYADLAPVAKSRGPPPSVVRPRRPTKVRNQKISRRPNKGKINKRPNKGRRPNKGSRKLRRFPLLVKNVTMQHPICYTLFEQRLDLVQTTYLLYASEDTDVSVTALISSAPNSRRSKRGAIRQIKVQAPDSTVTLNGVTLGSRLNTTSAYFTLTRYPGSYFTININGAKINVQFSNAQNEFYVNVNSDPGTFSSHGIVGEILAHDVAVRHQNRRKASLTIGAERYSAVLRKIPVEMQFDSCLNIQRREQDIYDMKIAS